MESVVYRRDTTNQQFKPIELNLFSLVNQNVQLLQNQALAKNIQIVVDVPDQHRLFADENMISAIIRNLLNNAIKFSTYGKLIKISSVEKPNELQLIVKDQGIGISDEVIRDIFSKDKMVSSAGTNKEKGSGLGLKIVQEFAKKNKGVIQINSKVGDGTEMIISFKK